MKIIIKSKNQKEDFVLVLPTAIICNRLGAKIAIKSLASKASQNAIVITGKDSGSVTANAKIVSAAVKELNKFRRKHKGFVFVEVDSANGDNVKITL